MESGLDLDSSSVTPLKIDLKDFNMEMFTDKTIDQLMKRPKSSRPYGLPKKSILLNHNDASNTDLTDQVVTTRQAKKEKPMTANPTAKRISTARLKSSTYRH